MADQVTLQNPLDSSILTAPIAIGGQQQAAPQQIRAQQAPVDPQQFYRGAETMQGSMTPALQRGLAGPSPDQVLLANTVLQRAKEREAAIDLKSKTDAAWAKEHPDLNALSNIWKSTNIGSRYAGAAAQREAMQNKIRQDTEYGDMKNVAAASQMLRQSDPEIIKAGSDYIRTLAGAGKDIQSAQSGENLQGAQANAAKSQASEFDSLANLHNVEAGQKPDELAEKQYENDLTAAKNILEEDKIHQGARDKVTEIYDKKKKEVDDHNAKAIDAYNKNLKDFHSVIPGKHGKAAKKYPGMEEPKPPVLLPPPTPSDEAAQEFVSSSQGQKFLNLIVRKSRIRPGAAPAGSPPVPPPPQNVQPPPIPTPSLVGPLTPTGAPTWAPPSLVGPQRPIGAPLVPGLVGGIPNPPGGTPQIQQLGQSQAGGQQQEINPKDIPIPFSIQTLVRKVPPLNQQKAQMMVDYYRKMIAKKHPEVEVLGDLTEGLNSLIPKLTAKK